MKNLTEEKYIVSIDQSTQGTKALLFNSLGKLICRADLPHEQIVNERGWVSHNLNEIYANTIMVFRNLIGKSGIDKADVAALGISNQRETTAMWNPETGEPLAHAVVWQCGRAEEISRKLEKEGYGETVLKKTGIPLSGYFPAAKMAWLLQNTEGAARAAKEGRVCLGTIDSWLVYKLTKGKEFKTDYSNASRTQLFNLKELRWDEELLSLFDIPRCALAEVLFSDSCFGYTDFEGFLDNAIPIRGVLGDSHGALFGQGCVSAGMAKATYGTGSSVMMNIGEEPILSRHGLVTSVAFGMDGKIDYCLEGNLNYTGAVISWLKNDLKLIEDASQTCELAKGANPNDTAYIVPAFTGLGAPYWDADAKAAIVGISRTTGKEEMVKAALECIGYQIKDLVAAMEQDRGAAMHSLRVDGGPSRNEYLMRFQSDILGKEILVPDSEELSGTGAAYAAGISAGIFERNKLFEKSDYKVYLPSMDDGEREKKYAGWKAAVGQVITTGK